MMRLANLPKCGNRDLWSFKAQTGPRNPKKSSLGVACVVYVNAFRQQTFTTALPPTCEGGATAFGPHTSAKAVLAFARSLGWLIGAFHKTVFGWPDRRMGKLGGCSSLSTPRRTRSASIRD